MTRMFTAAAFAAGLMALSGTAQAQAFDWDAANRGWTPPPRAQCLLELNRIYQPNPGQPIHLVITNRSGFRVQYTVNITLTRGRETTTGRSSWTMPTTTSAANARPSRPFRAACGVHA